jgi:UDP-3-O-[3-hydroxymyristoyl] glucosamine N-acyltransferase
VVEAGCVLGERVVLDGGVALGRGVRVGDDSWLHAGVVCYRGVTIGTRTVIHANTVIGAEGYGYVQEGGDPADVATDWHRYQQHPSPHVRLPQLGTVVIGDDVEIGACVCVDRGTIGATTIGSGTKIDNLVQIAHNVTVGEHCLITAQVSLSGSTTVGRHVTIGGNAGVGEGVRIGDRVLLAAKTAVPPHKVIPDGAAAIGIPAHLGEKGIAIVATQALLPRMLEQLRDLRRRVAELERALDAERSS